MIPVLTVTPRTKLYLIAALVASWLLIAPIAFADKSISDPRTTPSVPASADAMPRIALDTGDIMDPPALTNAQAAGARIARLTVAWSAIEPQNTDPSHYNWASTDSRLHALTTHGLSPLVVILGCPTWACVNDNGPINDNMRPEVAQFMGAMVARYSQPAYNTHYWEIWNEPDSAGGADRQLGWGMHPDKYAQMLAAIYPVMKAADPDAVVISGGIAFDNWFNQGGPFNPTFLPDLLTNNGARYMDAIAFHYYKNNNNGWTNIGLKIVQIRGVLAQHGVNLPLICTESGLTSSTNYGSSEQIQARYMIQMHSYAAANGVQTTVWYLNRDFPAREPGWEVFSMSGLTRLDNTPKLSFTAMQVFSREVGSGLFLRQLGVNDGVTGALEGYLFKGATPTRHTSVVWNNGAGQITLAIPAAQAPDLLGALDLYGQPLTTQPGPNGSIQVIVGSDPIYLQWVSARFDDVPRDAWEYPYIEYLASRGVVSGYTDGTFRPGNPATRGQFSKMVVLGMGWQLNTTGGPHFGDVPQTQAFYAYVETAYARGIINGYSCGASGEPCPGVYFRPMTNITRSQITKLVVLSKAWALITPSAATFSDVPLASPFFAFVETAVSHQVVSGYSDSTFRPGNNATRAQLSKMLSIALQQP